MTRNQDLNVLHVDDATQWAAPLDARVVSGDTLIFDFVYFLHPVSISLAAQLSHARVMIAVMQEQSYQQVLQTIMSICHCHHHDIHRVDGNVTTVLNNYSVQKMLFCCIFADALHNCMGVWHDLSTMQVKQKHSSLFCNWNSSDCLWVLPNTPIHTRLPLNAFP